MIYYHAPHFSCIINAVKIMSFKAINLSNKMIISLSRQGYFSPSEIQLRVIPKALKGETLMVQSATGTGKTHAYLIPIIDKIDVNDQNVQAIIIAPTRELASQIFEFASKFQKEFSNLKIKLFKSGVEKKDSLEGLSVPPHIIIGTPGRIKDVLSLEKSLSLAKVKTVVLDEADMLLKEGFFSDIDEITARLTSKPEFLVFSATLEANLSHELERYVGPNVPVVNEEVMTSSNVKHYLIDTRHQDVFVSVEEFINYVKPYLLLIFSSKKETANKVYAYLNEKKYKVGLLTGDLSSRERKSVMRMLKNEQIYILVCSDMAARGLDIEGVSDVLNIDLPGNLEFYFHRAGRTGRFSKKGNCYTFYNNESTRKPLELISQGVKFEYLSLKDGELKEGKPIEKSHPNKRKMDSELQKQINIINAKMNTKKKGVKPGYKKKRKEEIAKAKQKHRREIIKKDIRRQRVERYKKESRGNE